MTDPVSRRVTAALVVAAEMLLSFAMWTASPRTAQAQFFDFGNFFGQQRRSPRQQWSPWPWQRPPPKVQQPVDWSRAPPPAARKPDVAPTEKIVVLGDSMADWLGFGLEETLAESPEIGIVRKHRAGAGLIRPETRQAYSWPQAAREIIAAEKPAYVVVMLGLNDRQSIRERPPRPGARPAAAAPQNSDSAARGQQPSGEANGPASQAQSESSPPAEPATPGPAVTYEFRSEKWGEAYGRRIDELIAALRAKDVTVLWVGLPPIRGNRASADMAYLNEQYRGHAEKLGITYVDLWDGFVDESGNFAAYGPDFEGQIRRLRSGDGVHFTDAGARKVAHYVERELRRAMLTHNAPVALPAEEPQPATPGAPAARPAAGPVIPLGTPTRAPEGLLGAAAARSPEGDANANRVLVKGETVPSLAGRADDFAWPKPVPAAVEPEPEPTPAAKPGAKPAAATTPERKPPKRHAPRPVASPGVAPGPLSLTNNTIQEPRRGRSLDNSLRPPGAVPFSPMR
jgi:uncharacterized protein